MDALLLPLDRVRLRALHALGPLASSLAGSRERRVAFTLLLAVITSLSLAVAAPVWLLTIAPLVWGVPHLVSDLRYLVVRPGWHRHPRLVWPLGIALLVATVVAGLPLAMLAAALGVALVHGPSRSRKLVAIAALALLALGAFQARRYVDAAFVQGHNVLALVLWWRWRPRDSRAKTALGVAALAGVLLVSGTLDGLLTHLSTWSSPFARFHAGALAASLAPGLGARWGRRLLVLYAFGQSLHYAVWLRLVPDDDRARPTPRTFRASFAAVRADLGARVLVVAALLAGVYLALTFADGAYAWTMYLRVSAIHGYLEVVALALSLVLATSPATTAPMAPATAAR
jgi:hypothetical protein